MNARVTVVEDEEALSVLLRYNLELSLIHI